MKMKNLLLVTIATLGFTAKTFAQNIPNYVPANGLVGWWPFNGNANDESGNGNNGTVNGAVLSSDRFGIEGKAYSFDGVDDFINFGNTILSAANSASVSFWFQTKNFTNVSKNIYNKRRELFGDGFGFGMYDSICGAGLNREPSINVGNAYGTPPVNFNTNWTYITVTWNGNLLSVYKNGILSASLSLPSGPFVGNEPYYFGKGFDIDPDGGGIRAYEGKIDDIGIWNRALNQQEITDLYNAVNCANNSVITPQINSLPVGKTATFNATTSDPNPTYVWQSNFGQGYQTLNDVENYSGTNTSTLNISNIQLANHNQPIRVITISGECVDTSDIATISILDTCVTSVNDTTFITVTDTLVINTLITGINPPNNSNTIKVYPNPANSHITIEYGDFAIMNGYQLRIENSLGQEVFQTIISQQSDYLNLNSWGGNGIYFVHIVDPQGNTIDIRKIVLQ